MRNNTITGKCLMCGDVHEDPVTNDDVLELIQSLKRSFDSGNRPDSKPETTSPDDWKIFELWMFGQFIGEVYAISWKYETADMTGTTPRHVFLNTNGRQIAVVWEQGPTAGGIDVTSRPLGTRRATSNTVTGLYLLQ